MEKIRQHKVFVIVTSIITLLPMVVGIILWNRLPEMMATHFGTDSMPNDWSPRGFTVFGIPIFLLAVHIICVFATVADQRNKGINQTVFKIVGCIAPFCSVACAVGIYGHELGFTEVNSLTAIKCTLAIMIIAVGNYLPKCRQNYTIGIKLPWTLEDEDIWNRTHRLAGWLWIMCGILIIAEAFLRFGGAWLIFVVAAVMVLVPVVYSLVIFMRNED